MVEMSMITSGLASLKAAKDIAEGLVNLRDTAKFQGAVVELQGKILAAHADQFALLERVRELETKVAEFEAWETEKKRYKLTDYGGGTFAYELKPEAAEGEPLHRVCPSCCYQKRHRSIFNSLIAVMVESISNALTAKRISRSASTLPQSSRENQDTSGHLGAIRLVFRRLRFARLRRHLQNPLRQLVTPLVGFWIVRHAYLQ
jgi:hypothetical protein